MRSRYSWFTVDEYQDTTPLQARLLELWLGERRDLCVVGDEDQTIYTFAGATPEHLVGFARRYPGAVVIPLLSNYRSSPQVLALANKLLASTGSCQAAGGHQGDGPEPVVRSFATAAEEEAYVVARVKSLLGRGRGAERDRGAAAAECADRGVRVGVRPGGHPLSAARQALLRAARGEGGGAGAGAGARRRDRRALVAAVRRGLGPAAGVRPR